MPKYKLKFKRTIKWNKYPDIKPGPNDDKDEDGVVTHWAEMPEGPEEL
jgi:hypothetical protein